MKNINKKINGYIEGYYGKLLTWSERLRILQKLYKNRMNFYLYAPKEDDKHRLNWKKNYDNHWLKNFQMFCKNAEANKVEIIVGLSPGLNFNFLNYKINLLKGNFSDDFKCLIDKISIFKNYGASNFALLFDDIPDNFYELNGTKFNEGQMHAELANSLSSYLKKPIYVVPRIYADQLIMGNNKYLIDYGNSIYNKNITFYSGKHIVSRVINKKKINEISKILKSKIVVWDNFYANDYCPRRLFLGPFTNRFEIENLMINPTGLIETDLLILDIVKITKNSKSPKNSWKKILKKNKIPDYFFNVSNYFSKPDFGENPKLKNIIVTKRSMDSLEHLLWKWKSPISREWYPYLLGLKHDLQLLQKQLPTDRVIKINTCGMSNFIFNNQN